MTQPKNKSGAIQKPEKKATKSQRISKLENALKEVQADKIAKLENDLKAAQAENSKINTMLASIRAKLESLQMQIDRHQSGFEYLADSSEKLRDSLLGAQPRRHIHDENCVRSHLRVLGEVAHSLQSDAAMRAESGAGAREE
ncbi:uncharacterized protein N7496_008850 [Penicillium cataractarum]|uniref:Uncharacterized protein n=1 Tax=Penicillium cataractarum TaxID=2100454 RepID=A0A9W9S0I0_9EURO|nr:uncharacterized protein N7496_008850 [Penicillium cataractarum]KAJ5369090.1 hypothetical protein N7496_008850 [Penicillium cataractarum]